MGSAKYVRPRDSTNYGRLRVDSALRELVAQLESRRSMLVPGSESLAGQIRELLQSMSSINSSIGLPTREALRKVVRCAYTLHLGNNAAKFSFMNRLSELGVATNVFNGRLARQIHALANYCRICVYLATAARSFHSAFRTLQLCTIKSAPKKRVVHAEVQLLLYHELSDLYTRPSIIPASKKPCLLCHSFMSAHGIYQVPDTHGEIFQKWYVPDKEAFSDNTSRQLNVALRATAQSVKSILAKFEAQPRGRDDPQLRAQSVIASELDKLCTPSVSTISTQDTQVGSVQSNEALSLLTSKPESKGPSTDAQRQQYPDKPLLVPCSASVLQESPEKSDANTTALFSSDKSPWRSNIALTYSTIEVQSKLSSSGELPEFASSQCKVSPDCI